MSDLIDRQQAIDAMLGDKVQITNVIRAIGNERDFEVLNCTCDRHAEIIKALPTVQPKHGKWIERESDTEDKENGFETVIVCSCCDFPATTFYSEDCESRTQIRTDFCPNCGADMRGSKDGTD